MTEVQMMELATLQGAYYKTVEDQDRSEQQAKLILITYWIRKQIWQEARMVIIKVNPEDWAKFGIQEVQLSKSTIGRFGDFQASMLKALAERSAPGPGPELWASYINWVSDLIDASVSALTGKYIKVIARRIKNN